MDGIDYPESVGHVEALLDYSEVFADYDKAVAARVAGYGGWKTFVDGVVPFAGVEETSVGGVGA